jgi:geranylgeranyl pyrophosphate synthase
MIHTYSLIHDDLPAMDDDALRRGRPTSHIVHGEGLAILAGDGLLTEAFRVLGTAPPFIAEPEGPSKEQTIRSFEYIAEQVRRLKAISRIAEAAGSAGMVGGQAIDLAAAGRVKGRSGRVTDAAALEDMHARKTGALIRAAAAVGAVMVGASEPVSAAIEDYARELGLAFQIIDDVLDIEGSNEALGKTAGKDAAAGKPTYPSLYGVTESRRLASECVVRARAALARVSLDGRLAEIAEWSLTRQA